MQNSNENWSNLKNAFRAYNKDLIGNLRMIPRKKFLIGYVSTSIVISSVAASYTQMKWTHKTGADWDYVVADGFLGLFCGAIVGPIVPFFYPIYYMATRKPIKKNRNSY